MENLKKTEMAMHERKKQQDQQRRRLIEQINNASHGGNGSRQRLMSSLQTFYSYSNGLSAKKRIGSASDDSIVLMMSGANVPPGINGKTSSTSVANNNTK
jgi:hypothetical protein